MRPLQQQKPRQPIKERVRKGREKSTEKREVERAVGKEHRNMARARERDRRKRERRE